MEAQGDLHHWRCPWCLPFCHDSMFFWIAAETDFFSNTFGVKSIRVNLMCLMPAVYLQVSIVSQTLIFVTRSRSWSFDEGSGALLVTAFLAAQLVATLIAVYASWSFARIQGCGWGWLELFGSLTSLPTFLLRLSHEPKNTSMGPSIHSI